jgi:hypothetical protein
MSPKVTVYSCSTNDYDKIIRKPFGNFEVSSWNLYTDNFNIECVGWNKKKLKHPDNLININLIDRWHKFYPHEFIDDVDISIYIDANIEIIGSIGPLIEEFYNSGKIIGFFKHPQRDNILDEIKACYRLNKIDLPEGIKIQNQLRKYQNQGFDFEKKLLSGGVIFRRHDNNNFLQNSMNLWWNELSAYTKRDQISLPYVLWRSNLVAHVFDYNIFNNKYLIVHRHKSRFFLPISIERYIRLCKRSIAFN